MIKDEEAIIKGLEFGTHHPSMDKEKNTSTTTAIRSIPFQDSKLTRRRTQNDGKLDRTTIVIAKVCATLVELGHAVESKCRLLLHINVPGGRTTAEWNALSGSITGLTRSLIPQLHEGDIDREVWESLLLDLEFFVTQASDMAKIREHMSDSEQVLPPFWLVEDEFKLLQRIEMFLLSLLHSVRGAMLRDEDQSATTIASPEATKATTTCFYILILGFLFGLVSLALTVYVSISLGGIGNGFNAGAWVLTFGGLALGPWVAAHSSHCSCWGRWKKLKTK